MHDDRTPLFVYGTLLRGLSRAQMLRESRFLGPALASGQLFDLGTYPALCPGPGQVVGELYTVDADTLQRIDRVEGFDPRHPKASLYHRVVLPVRPFFCQLHAAAAYLYPHDPDPAVRIAHGDYRRYLRERKAAIKP